MFQGFRTPNLSKYFPGVLKPRRNKRYCFNIIYNNRFKNNNKSCATNILMVETVINTHDEHHT